MSHHTLAHRSHTVPSLAAPSLASTRSGGQTLDRVVQTRMSARFGHDFSQIRIHTDAQAARAAQATGALAFAHGADIVFGEGQYQPGSPQTERLLAHELTHVVQQARFGAGDLTRQSRKSDTSEREADTLASQVMRGRSVEVQAAPQAAVARWGDDDPAFRANPMPDMPDHPLRWGSQPADKSVSGPYAYSNFDPPKPGDHIPSGAAGFGVAHARGDIGGVPVGDDILAGSMNYGAMKDDNGDTRYGAKASGSVVAMDFNKGGKVSGDVQALNAGAEASFGSDGATLGATANAVAGSITAQDEHQTSRLGLSAGVGLAGRTYWGEGKDGFRNYGFGFDAGPLSVDLKTNDVLRTGVGLIPGLGPVAQQFLPDGNMTENAANMVGLSTKNADLGTTWDAAKGVAGNAYDTGSQAVSGAAGAVSNAAGSAYDWLSGAASNIDPASVVN